MASMLPQYFNIQTQVTQHLLQNLLTDPEHFSNHIKLYVLPLLQRLDAPAAAPGAQTVG